MVTTVPGLMKNVDDAMATDVATVGRCKISKTVAAVALLDFEVGAGDAAITDDQIAVAARSDAYPARLDVGDLASIGARENDESAAPYLEGVRRTVDVSNPRPSAEIIGGHIATIDRELVRLKRRAAIRQG